MALFGSAMDPGRRFRPFLFAPVAALILACAPYHMPQQAYDGSPRPLDELSMIVASQGAGAWGEDRYLDSALRTVVIQDVDGREEIGEWRTPERRPIVEPGRHELRVRPLETLIDPVGGGLFTWTANLQLDQESQKLARTLVIETEAGFAYRLYYLEDPARYLVKRVPIPYGEEKIGLVPRAGAIECRTRDEGRAGTAWIDCGNGVVVPEAREARAR